MTTFLTSDSGAVTVDWVVLTAALVGLGLATMGVVSSGVENASTDIKTQLESHHIINASFNHAPEVGNIISVGDGIGYESCEAFAYLDPSPTDPAEVCDIQRDSASYTYAMSDGSEWTKTVIHNGGQPYQTRTLIDGTEETIGLNSGWETIWTDGDGNVVDDPNA